MAMAVAARPHVVDAGMERRTALMAAAAEGSVYVLAQLGSCSRGVPVVSRRLALWQRNRRKEREGAAPQEPASDQVVVLSTGTTQSSAVWF